MPSSLTKLQLFFSNKKKYLKNESRSRKVHFSYLQFIIIIILKLICKKILINSICKKILINSGMAALENLETQLELFIENVRQIRIVVSDFQPGQNILNQKIQGLVTGLQEIDKLRKDVQDVHVPFEVFDYIDQDKNPQLYTKDCIEKALTKNEEVKGKIDAYKKFKTNMLVELQKTFPNELNMYRAIRDE